jgi:hypothetical protein
VKVIDKKKFVEAAMDEAKCVAFDRACDACLPERSDGRDNWQMWQALLKLRDRDVETISVGLKHLPGNCSGTFDDGVPAQRLLLHHRLGALKAPSDKALEEFRLR